MKKTLLCSLLSLTFASYSLETTEQQDQTETFDLTKLSMAFGHLIGKNITSSPVQLEVSAVIEGIKKGAAGDPPIMSDQEFAELMGAFQRETLKQEAEKNITEATGFLSLNKEYPSVIELEPGKLQYLVLEEGEGETVQEGDTPLIHYTGSYIDGTTFGSSHDTTGPVAIPLDQTIPGFSRGILGMKEGEKRKLFVHPDLAYGMSGSLKPNALLIFEVEVIKASTQETDGEEESDQEDQELIDTIESPNPF